MPCGNINNNGSPIPFARWSFYFSWACWDIKKMYKKSTFLALVSWIDKICAMRGHLFTSNVAMSLAQF